MGLVHSSFVVFPNPRNLNYWWTFGGILAFMLAAQIVTGVVLVMHYTPESTLAFASVEHIMRDVNYGWLLRYVARQRRVRCSSSRSTSIFSAASTTARTRRRAKCCGLLGIVIYLLMMGDGLHGLRAALGADERLGRHRHHQPVLGDPLRRHCRDDNGCGAAISPSTAPTLNRFFSLHYLLPFMIAGVVVLHIWALHVPGSNNPAGIEPTSSSKGHAALPSRISP